MMDSKISTGLDDADGIAQIENEQMSSASQQSNQKNRTRFFQWLKQNKSDFKDRCHRIIQIITPRSFVIAECCYVMYLISCSMKNSIYWTGLICVLVIIAESAYLIIKHDSRDFYW